MPLHSLTSSASLHGDDVLHRFMRALLQTAEVFYYAIKHLEAEPNATVYGRQIIAEMCMEYPPEKPSLLEMVEPLPSTPPKPNYLLAQPIELLDRICYFLLDPKDLISFALTSKAAQTIVVPRHVDFRILRSDVRWKNIWDTLLGNPGTAARFSSLEIVAESSARFAVPQSMFTPEDLAQVTTRSWEAPSIHRLTQLTRYMSGLTRFHWMDGSIRLTDYTDLLSAIRESCPALVDVQIHNKRILDQPSFYEDEPPPIDANEVKKIKENISSCRLWELSDLVRFSYVSNGDGLGADYSRMYDMLINRCPRLEDLQLYNHMPLLAPIFSRARWPRLKRLSFRGRSFRAVDQAAFDDFCRAHPTLESLHIDGPLAVNLSHLPNLKSLHISLDSFYRRVPPSIAPQLENLSLVVDMNPRTAEFAPLPLLPHVRHLLLAGKNIPKPCLEQIASAAPNVEKLALASSVWSFFKKPDFLDTNGAFVTLLDFISRFSRLTHFSRLGIHTTCDPAVCPFFNGVLDRIAGALPSLQYINVLNGEDKRRWLAIERYPRERPGAFAQWTKVAPEVEQKKKDLKPQEWAGFQSFESLSRTPWSL